MELCIGRVPYAPVAEPVLEACIHLSFPISRFHVNKGLYLSKVVKIPCGRYIFQCMRGSFMLGR